MIGFRPQSLCRNLLEGKIATLTAAIGRGAQQYLCLHLRSSTHSPFQLRNVFVMRAIWKGRISFGLVNIPIALYPATRREELKFRLLRAKDLSPVNYKRVAEKDGKEVRLETDNTTQMMGQIRKGDRIVATVNDQNHALSIRSTPTNDRRNEKSESMLAQ